MENKLEEKAKEIQNECHKAVELAFKERELFNNFSYQDATNVFIFRKLAEYELRIKQLEVGL